MYVMTALGMVLLQMTYLPFFTDISDKQEKDKDSKWNRYIICCLVHESLLFLDVLLLLILPTDSTVWFY